MLPVIVLVSLNALASASRYNGYQLLSVNPTSAKDAEVLRDAVELLDLDQWTPSLATNKPSDILVSPKVAKVFISLLENERIPFSVKIPDVQRIIDVQDLQYENKETCAQDSAFDHSRFQSYLEIQKSLDLLSEKYPSLVNNYVAGITYEGRNITVTVVSADGHNTKETIWIDCGIHAREWLTSATCQWILHKLTSGYGTSDDVTNVLNKYDVHIMTLVNPDGYVYSREKNRLWRKNRSYDEATGCYGVDPNRNFDSCFECPHSSDNPCENSYHGPYVFSEAESSAIRDSLMKLGNRTKMYFSLHSYSQLWLLPYGYTNKLPPNYAKQLRIAEAAVNAIKAVHESWYIYGTVAAVIYKASGISSDWAYETGIPYSFALELRDTGIYGYLAPPEEIIPTGEETWAGILAAINALK